ncbi:MAG: transposase [Candidatus Pacebacteria bacterium]|jgi:putative transposase|nr:transposase [Candidatus Paceibacterota bacterium]
MERKFNFSVDEYYHIYSRGVEKREIFLDNGDKERFLRLLFLSNSGKPFNFREVSGISFENISRGEPRTAIGAFCLMPNHFHLLLRETEEGGISAFIGKLLTGYSMYFNKKYKRKGVVFESRFQAQHVDNDNYLKYLFAYIHLNPVKLIEPEWKEKGIKDQKFAEDYLNKYRYSSYEDHMGTEREEALILDKESFPEYFERSRDFKDYVTDWLNYRDEEEGGGDTVPEGGPR